MATKDKRSIKISRFQDERCWIHSNKKGYGRGVYYSDLEKLVW